MKSLQRIEARQEESATDLRNYMSSTDERICETEKTAVQIATALHTEVSKIKTQLTDIRKIINANSTKKSCTQEHGRMDWHVQS